MKTFTFNALTTYKNNCSQSRVITFEYDSYIDKRSTSLLSVINDNKHLHDCYLIDHDTKCNITFDLTVELKGGLFEETKKGYMCDRSFYTFNELLKEVEILNKRGDFIRVVTQPFMRFHYSKSGKAVDYLVIHELIKKSDNLHDGGLWFDSSLHFEKIKDNFTRNSFNEVIYTK